MGAWIRYHLALATWLAGQPDRAVRTAHEALAVARRGGRPFSIAQTLTNAAALHLMMGNWEAVEAFAAEGREVGGRHGIPDFAMQSANMAAVAAAALRDAVRGTAAAREGIVALERNGWRCTTPLLLSQLALPLARSGALTEAARSGGRGAPPGDAEWRARLGGRRRCACSAS